VIYGDTYKALNGRASDNNGMRYETAILRLFRNETKHWRQSSLSRRDLQCHLCDLGLIKLCCILTLLVLHYCLYTVCNISFVVHIGGATSARLWNTSVTASHIMAALSHSMRRPPNHQTSSADISYSSVTSDCYPYWQSLHR